MSLRVTDRINSFISLELSPEELWAWVCELGGLEFGEGDRGIAVHKIYKYVFDIRNIYIWELDIGMESLVPTIEIVALVRDLVSNQLVLTDTNFDLIFLLLFRRVDKRTHISDQ